MNQGVEITGLYKSFPVDGNPIEILKDINLTVEDGQCLAIVGHSGCGKSTLLKIVAGLVPYEIGSVKCNGVSVSGPGVDRGVVFQEHRLLPWLTVEENISFGLAHLSGAQQKEITRKYISMVKLDGFAKAYPSQLSGGMAQRAAIARALAGAPNVLLLDEPFGALDALTRITLQHELLRIRKEEKTTMILVTHDIDEAVFLGNAVAVMSARPGAIQQYFAIELGASRDRGSNDFAYFKNKIFEQFFQENENLPDYTL